MDNVMIKKAMSGDSEHVENLVRYMLDDRKLDYGGNGVNYTDPDAVIEQMHYPAQYFDKEHCCPMTQIIISFDNSVKDPETAASYIKQAADQLPDEFQSLYCLHEADHECSSLHGHILVNSISTKDGRQFDTSRKQMAEFGEKLSEITGNDNQVIFKRTSRK